MTIKAIVFDLWGTLIFSELQHGLAKKITMKLNLSNEKEFWKILGRACCMDSCKSCLEMAEKFCHYVGKEDKKIVKELTKIWNSIKIPIFPETIPTLGKLKNYKIRLGLISNTEEVSAIRVMKKYNLKKYFDVIVFSYEAHLLKPDPKIFRLILNKLKVNPSEASMVGDSIKEDIIPAKNLGMKTILIDREFKNIKSKYADFTINSLDEIFEIGCIHEKRQTRLTSI